MSCSASPRDHHPVRVARRILSDSLPQTRVTPDLDILIPPPDLSDWIGGNTGLRGVIQHDSGRVGPHVVLVSLIHGNEYAGALALDRILRDGATPKTGVVSVIFANLDAFARFDPRNPAQSRFIDEDMNRVWDDARLTHDPHSLELARARELLPVIKSADILLDLHSMLWRADPLLIVPDTPRSWSLATRTAEQVPAPQLIATDLGHRGGARLIEQRRFRTVAGPARAMLLEAGQHWRPETVDTAYSVARAVLAHARSIHLDHMPEAMASHGPPQQVIVTDNVLARSATFAFSENYHGGQIIPCAGTVIAQDGNDAICTPYDDCALIMPNLRPRRGQLAVRLARTLKGADRAQR